MNLAVVLTMCALIAMLFAACAYLYVRLRRAEEKVAEVLSSSSAAQVATYVRLAGDLDARIAAQAKVLAESTAAYEAAAAALQQLAASPALTDPDKIVAEINRIFGGAR